jgi:hypothetical protein
MDPIVVEKQALAPARHQVQPLSFLIALDLEAAAEFHQSENANQPLTYAVLSGIFRVRASLSVCGEANTPPVAQPSRFRQRGLLQLLAHLLHMVTEVLATKLCSWQIGLHAIDVGEEAQCPSKHQPVKAGKDTCNLRSVFCDKLLHIVSVPPEMRGLGIPIRLRGTETPFGVAAPPRRGIPYDGHPALGSFIAGEKASSFFTSLPTRISAYRSDGPNDTHVDSYPRREAKDRTIRLRAAQRCSISSSSPKMVATTAVLRKGFKRVVATTVFFGTERRPDSSCLIECPRIPGELRKLIVNMADGQPDVG